MINITGKNSPDSLNTVFLTNISQAAFVTVRGGSGCTDLPAVINETVAEIASFFRGNDFPECHLYLFRILYVIHKTDAICEADTVGVSDDGRFLEYISHNQIGTFSPYAGKLQQSLEVLRDFGTILVPKHFHASADVSGFTFSKTAGAYDLFDILNICVSQSVDTGVFFE